MKMCPDRRIPAIHWAAANNMVPTIRKAITYGADMNHRDE